MSLNNRPKSPALLLERCEINVYILDHTVAGNIETMFLEMGMHNDWMSIEQSRCFTYLHLELFDRLPILKTLSVREHRHPILLSPYNVVLQHLVLDWLISLISQENLQNVGEKLAFLYVPIVSRLYFRSLDSFSSLSINWLVDGFDVPVVNIHRFLHAVSVSASPPYPYLPILIL